jgi:hypothetical protein
MGGIASRRGAGATGAIPASAAALVALTVLVIWLVAGVDVSQILRVLGYELAYVFFPGWVLHEVLAPRTTSRLRRVVFSLALGQVIEVVLFALTMALGARWLFTLFPLVFVALGAWAWTRRTGRAQVRGIWANWRLEGSVDSWSLALAGACVISLLALVVTHYLTTPLPAQISNEFTYQHDYIFHLSIAGEALHHWPLGNPNVAGTPLRYHWFSYFHLAGMAQVTGVSLPVVYFAIFPAILLLLLLCELALAGPLLGGALWAGPIAALMLLFVGEIDFSKPELAPFLEVMPIYLRYSPPFLFGATMFVPALISLCETLEGERPSRGQWAILALLLIGCSGGEAAIVPLLGGGIGGFLVYRWLTTRAIDRRALVALGVTIVVFLLSVVAFYSGSSSGLAIAFPGSVQLAPPFSYALPYIHGWHMLFWALATVALILGLCGASALGLLWLPRRLRELRAREVVPLSIFLIGLLVVAFCFQDSGGERYFAMFGVIAIIPLSAGGLARLFARWRGVEWRRLLPVAAVALISLVLAWVFVFNVHFGGNPEVGPRYFRPYGIFVAVVLLLIGWVLISPRPLRARRALYPVVVVLAAALVNFPSDYRSWIGKLFEGETVSAEVGPGLSPNYYEGLRWIRAHTSDDAVLAVDNLQTPETKTYGPLYFYVAAFAERRTLMQGWEYSAEASTLGFTAVQNLEAQPFPGRIALQNAVFRHGSAAALQQMESRYGVTTLVVDRQTGAVSPRFLRLVRPVYKNPAIVVYVPRR